MKVALSAALGSAAVLVVDDDGAMVTLIRRIVERLGHRCVTADSGEAAMQQLSVARFDLLITDINMGGFSGLDLLEAARGLDGDLAVMVVTGIGDPATAETALLAGAFGYIVKPFDVMELQIAVSNALRRRELEIELRGYLHDLEAEIDRRTVQLRAATQDAKVQEQRFRSLAQASPLGIIYADPDGELDYCNANAQTLLGRSADEITGRRWLTDLDSPNRNRLEDAVSEAASGALDSICEYELRRPDGSTAWVESRVEPVLNREDVSSGVVVLFEDISDQKRLEHQLRYQATHDHLTGLPNRREFRTQLSNRLRSLADGDVLALLMIDLDQFKLVNDTYGHEAGDQMIAAVAERLVEGAPPGALVARLGGDEFVVVLCEPASDRDLLLGKANSIRRAMRKSVRILGVELSLSVSIGIGSTSDAKTTASSLLRNADIAMHHAKISRDVVELFDTSMAKDVARRLELTSALRQAVDDESLTVDYQPIVDTVTQRVVGLEALARWRHDEWGQVAPDEFIPIAESMGLVHEIDRQILSAALGQLAHWRAAGRIHPDVFMSVNLSASQLSNSALPDLVFQTLLRAGVDGSSLCVEVTENSLISDLDRAVPVMRRLRELGIRIAVDDFGTGHSALSYLGQLPLDVLKIDRSFIAAIGSGAVDVSEAIVDLAHRFDLEVIAEGVEEPHQLSRLRALGCDMVQGFLTGRPVDADRAVPVATSDSWRVAGSPHGQAASALGSRNEIPS